MKTVKDDPKLGEIDFSNAKPVSQVPALAKLQAKRRAEKALSQAKPSFIESDVWQLLCKNADKPSEMTKVNGMLRLMLS